MAQKRLKYIMTVKKQGTNDSEAWTEPIKEELDEPHMKEDEITSQSHAESIIEFFNNTLREGEIPRVLVSVQDVPIEEGDFPEEDHDEEE